MRRVLAGCPVGSGHLQRGLEKCDWVWTVCPPLPPPGRGREGSRKCNGPRYFRREQKAGAGLREGIGFRDWEWLGAADTRGRGWKVEGEGRGQRTRKDHLLAKFL